MLTTKQKILNASLELFSTKGYNATTTKEIAKTCSLHESTIFRNFSSKKEIFETILEDCMQIFSLTDFYQNEMTDDLHDSILKLYLKYKELYIKFRMLYKILFRSALSGEYFDTVNNTIGAHATSLLIEYFESIKDKYKFKASSENLAHFCLSLINGMHTRSMALNIDDDIIDDKVIVEMILNGIIEN